jgi:hypothetical protein
LCFNVIYPTVSVMLVLISTLAAIVLAVVFSAVLVREGFRHGDVAGDARVRARTLAQAEPGAAGRWLEVTITNPSAAIALTAVRLRRSRVSWVEATPQRRTAGRWAGLSVREWMLGAVPARGSAVFHLWAEGDIRRLRLLVAVGTPGRLRLHRLPVPKPRPADAARAGLELPDPREPALP